MNPVSNVVVLTLIVGLNSSNYKVREQSYQALIKLDDQAIVQMQVLENSSNPEIARRAVKIVDAYYEKHVDEFLPERLPWISAVDTPSNEIDQIVLRYYLKNAQSIVGCSVLAEDWRDYRYATKLFLQDVIRTKDEIDKAVMLAQEYDKMLGKLALFCENIAKELGYDNITLQFTGIIENKVYFGLLDDNEKPWFRFSFPVEWLAKSAQEVAKFILEKNEKPSLILHVSQNSPLDLNCDKLNHVGAIEPWLSYLERLLELGGEYQTYDEHVVLIAQWLKRRNMLSKVVVNWYSESDKTTIYLDDEGDFSDDIPGGFFNQRLRYLR